MNPFFFVCLSADVILGLYMILGTARVIKYRNRCIGRNALECSSMFAVFPLAFIQHKKNTGFHKYQPDDFKKYYQALHQR